MSQVNLDPKAPHVQQTPKKQAHDFESIESFKDRFSPDEWAKYSKNPDLNQFLAKLKPKELKAFWQNTSRYCSQVITRHMRKMKEANERMKESFQKK